jgi:GNAT superfamily N-acetyltransferase
MNDSIAICLASADEIQQLAELRWLLQTDDDVDASRSSERNRFLAAFTEIAQDRNEGGDFFHWVAKADQRILAVMSVEKVRKLLRPGESRTRCWGYLTNCYTRPEHRGKGIGGSLLETVKQWAKEEQLEFLIVWPSDPSYGFYQRAGFQRGRDPLVLPIGADS